MGQVGQVGREGLLGELDNWYHEDSGGVSDLLDLDLFNELQAEEPPGEIHILMQPLIEDDGEGMSVTVSGTFQNQFHRMIYQATFAGHEFKLYETPDQMMRYSFPATIFGDNFRAVEVLSVISGTRVVDRAEAGGCLSSVSALMNNFPTNPAVPSEEIPFTYTIKYRT